MSNETGTSTEEVSKQNVEGVVFLLNAYSKLGEEGNNVNMEFLIKTEVELKIGEIVRNFKQLQLIC